LLAINADMFCTSTCKHMVSQVNCLCGFTKLFVLDFPAVGTGPDSASRDWRHRNSLWGRELTDMWQPFYWWRKEHSCVLSDKSSETVMTERDVQEQDAVWDSEF